MLRKTLRTREELDGILAEGGLELAEAYDPLRSYPKNAWLFTRCKQCGTEAHYQLRYVMDKSGSDELVCRACYWTDWLWRCERLAPYTAACLSSHACENEDDASRYAAKFGFDLVRLIIPGLRGEALLLVRCQA